MNESGSEGWFDALFGGDPALLAGLMGALLVIVGLLFAIRLAFAATDSLRRNDRGRLPAGFDDAWWALRHAAYFCLAVISLGVLLLLAPALGSLGDEPSASPSSSPDAAATEGDGNDKHNKADKADKPGRGNQGDDDDEEDEGEGEADDTEGRAEESQSSSASPSPSGS